LYILLLRASSLTKYTTDNSGIDTNWYRKKNCQSQKVKKCEQPVLQSNCGIQGNGVAHVYYTYITLFKSEYFCIMNFVSNIFI